MDIRELKQLLKHSASVLIMENGEPSLVVTNYQTFRSMGDAQQGEGAAPVEVQEHNGQIRESGQQSALSVQELEMIDRLNKEIMALKEQIEAEEREVTE
jgi:hypothetical protein